MKFVLRNLLDNVKESISLFFETLVTFIRIIFESRFSSRLPEAGGEICYIMMNGPSLKKSLEKHKASLDKVQKICVNSFSTTNDFLIVKPDYYVLLDPKFYVYDESKLPEFIKNAIDGLVEKTNWDLILFLPNSARKAKYLSIIPERNRKIRIVYFNYTIIRTYSFLRNFFFRRNIGMPSCYNVLGACIFLSLNMGYKKTFLFGADHNYGQNLYVNEQNEICMIHHHFYSDGKPFITPIYKTYQKKEKMNMAQYYELCTKIFDVYYILEDYSKKLGSKIYNATPDSFIDAFKRKQPGD